MAELKITKQAVAYRLIVSAVRMFEEDFDPLVIHATAASASNLLRELVARRGQNYGSRIFAVALHEETLARHEQRKPVASLPSHPEIELAVREVEQGIRDGIINSPSDIDVAMPKSVEANLMRDIVAPYNFMKHADRDPEGILDTSDLQPKKAIGHAIGAYTLLFPGEPLEASVQAFVGAFIGRHTTG